MITLMLGLQGSGKTACCVREIMKDISGKTFFSNIITFKIKNNVVIKPEMIYKKEIIKVKKSGEVTYKYSVNKEFWQNAVRKHKSLNVIIDEAHSILNARRAMSKHVQPILDWISLLRRVLGSTESGHGELYLVSQIERRIDVVAKEQSTQIRYHVCHYKKTCKKCLFTVNENNEIPEQMFVCPVCKSILIKHSHIIEVWHFVNYDNFIRWKYYRLKKSYYKHYYVTDIEEVFPFYNTMQWDNLISQI